VKKILLPVAVVVLLVTFRAEVGATLAPLLMPVISLVSPLVNSVADLIRGVL
jgi:hypothetical protein